MSGHSKWAQIKRSKGAADVKRGASFTKLAREITLAAKTGTPDPDLNFRLRLAVQNAKQGNMPADNIDRAIKRATGRDAGLLEEIQYEGYGPGGTALLIQTMTDNRNRTVAEVRSTLMRAGGSLGETGSVSWQFDNRGVITINGTGKDADDVMLVALEAGADDIHDADEEIYVYTEPATLEGVRKALEDQGLTVVASELSMVPKVAVNLEEKDAVALVRLVERLEDLDDVQQVFSNAEIDDAVLSSLG